MINRRYLKLMSEDDWNNLLERYPISKILEYDCNNTLVKRVYIPKELSLRDYITSRTRILSNEGGWVGYQGFNRAVPYLTNNILTSKDFVDIFMFRILNGIGPVCRICGKPLQFKGGLNGPYNGKFTCSHSCGTTLMNNRLWNMENSPFKTKEYKTLKKRLAREMAKEGKIGLGNKNCSLSNTLSIYSKYKTMYLYILSDIEKFKIGISHIPMGKERIYRQYLSNVFRKESTNVCIYSGDTNDIVRLENEIKFNDRFIKSRYFSNGELEGWQEIFKIDVIDELPSIINKYNVQKVIN